MEELIKILRSPGLYDKGILIVSPIHISDKIGFLSIMNPLVGKKERKNPDFWQMSIKYLLINMAASSWMLQIMLKLMIRMPFILMQRDMPN